MIMERPTKSCGPQLFPEDLPSTEWDVDQLGEYAASQHEAIAGDEKTLAPRYWRLGLALDLARKQIRHGNWNRFMAEHGIDRTRASRARAIHRAFPNEDLLAGLTVEEAYSRREKRGGGRSSVSQDPHRRLASCLKSLRSVAEELASEAEWTSRDSTADLLNDLDEAVNHLERIRDVLKKI